MGEAETMRMGVVADDVTGSNDIGIMFAKSGYLVHVYNFDAARPPTLTTDGDGPDVVILNTNSRLDPPGVAAAKVRAATLALRDAGCRRFHNKTCSVFRGNIGAEFDAMLDALGLDFAVVVLGFPKNGRQTIDGIHYVHGRRLEDSEFRNDPVHPMTRSDLVGILGSQTRRSAGLVDHRTVAAGPDALRRALAGARMHVNYAIVDVVDQSSLVTIAAAAYDQPVLCGSSALAEELPRFWGPRSSPLPGLNLAPAGGLGSVRHPERSETESKDGPGSPTRLGILCAAGSQMPQTQAQVAALLGRGAADGSVSGLELRTEALFDPATRETEIATLAGSIVTQLRAGRDVVVRTLGGPAAVALSRVLGSRAGLSDTETARLVSSSLAEVTGRAVEQCGLNRLVVAGGETSDAVCERLGVAGMRIWQEIQPGLPSCVSLTEPPRLLVLKSGSFGTDDFLVQAVEHLRNQ